MIPTDVAPSDLRRKALEASEVRRQKLETEVREARPGMPLGWRWKSWENTMDLDMMI
jgi:hypothetical protein